MRSSVHRRFRSNDKQQIRQNFVNNVRQKSVNNVISEMYKLQSYMQYNVTLNSTLWVGI